MTINFVSWRQGMSSSMVAEIKFSEREVDKYFDLETEMWGRGWRNLYRLGDTTAICPIFNLNMFESFKADYKDIKRQLKIR